MLITSMQMKHQQQIDNSTLFNNPLPCVTVSYDLENYYSLLTHISQDSDQRWILFIAPPGKPNSHFLQQAGIHKNRIITLPQKKINNQTELLKNALKSNNYATVITWLSDCDKSLQNEINEIASLSNSRCFIYCTQ